MTVSRKTDSQKSNFDLLNSYMLSESNYLQRDISGLKTNEKRNLNEYRKTAKY